MTDLLTVHTQREMLHKNGYAYVPLLNGLKKTRVETWPAVAEATLSEGSVPWPSDKYCNTGIYLGGSSRLLALDIDVHHGEYAVGEALVQLATSMLGPAPIRMRENTARVTLLYRLGVGEFGYPKLKGSLGEIEFLTNGQCVAYGDFRGDESSPAGAYSWRNEIGPHSKPYGALTCVPHTHLEAFRNACIPLLGVDPASVKAPRPDPIFSPSVGTPANDRQPPTEHERNIALAALREHAERVARAPRGDRNAALNREALPLYEMCAAGWIGEEEIRTAFEQACHSNGLINDDGMQQFHATLKSARKKGFSQPRAPLSVVPNVDVSGIVNGQGKNNMFSPNGHRSVMLRRGIDIQPKAKRWLWRGWLTKGKVTLLAGNPGTGKSTITLSFTATVTTGGEWPDGTRCKQQGKVLIWSSEDDVEDTIVPRLIAAGADPYRYGVIDGTTDGTLKKPFDPSRDMDLLREEIRRIGGIDLLVVDPIIAVTRGKNNDAAIDVRDALQPLIDLALEFDCAVIGITHRRKSSGGRREVNPLDSVLGSGAYSQVARGVLGTVRDITGQCTLFRMKSSIGKEGDGFHYEIHSVPLPNDDETSRIQWGEPVSGSASEIVHTAESDGSEDDKHGNKLNAAMHLLRTELGNGPRSQSEMETLCKTHGFSRSTMMRAKAEVGVKSRKVTGTMIGGWEWYLPIQPNFSALLSSGEGTP